MADFIFQKKGESTWYARLAVPADVQERLGRKVFIQSLKTASRTEAVHASHTYLAVWRDQIKTARKAKEPPEGWQENIIAAATEMETLIQNRKRAIIGENVPSKPITDAEVNAFNRDHPYLPGYIGLMAAQMTEKGIAGELALRDDFNRAFKTVLQKSMATKYQLTSEQRQELAALVADPTSHKAKSPITKARLAAFRAYRVTQKIAPKTIDQQESKLEKLSAYLTSNLRPLEFDTVSAWLGSLQLTRKTLTQYLLAGSMFWKWANRNDERWRAEYKDRANPFVSHELPKMTAKERADSKRKDWSLENLSMLHDAAMKIGNITLADLILLGLYTGARIEELCELTRDNVVTIEGVQCFDFIDAKTFAGIRTVPIHPALKHIVNRLVKGSKDGFLIPSNSRNKYDNRSDPLSKAFGRLKTAHGFGRSHVFHSIRATVVTQLQRADVKGTLIAEIVGHETGTVTFDVYDGGASPAQKLKAISKLPKLKPWPNQSDNVQAQ
ncbi:DUF6538 domain-containing protein [Pseudomonas sp. MWU13-2100]|uniref:DUF6538 domain-containing protein n=1 Tax=Pseudomonas sp. MWU13-2100 TaxID=2935075 RepID=UPI00200BE8AA|nr:DUF6538 domain-containing protein [Pseudomonas sp. MWU13-2100]